MCLIWVFRECINSACSLIVWPTTKIHFTNSFRRHLDHFIFSPRPASPCSLSASTSRILGWKKHSQFAVSCDYAFPCHKLYQHYYYLAGHVQAMFISSSIQKLFKLIHSHYTSQWLFLLPPICWPILTEGKVNTLQPLFIVIVSDNLSL